MSQSKSSEDCHFFLTAECREGEACQFRHSEAVKANPTVAVCQYWQRGNCGKLSCGFRHPSLPKAPVFNPNWQMMMPQAPPICKYFMQGTCNKGIACPFPHGYPQYPMAPPNFYAGGGGGGGGGGGSNQHQQHHERHHQGGGGDFNDRHHEGKQKKHGKQRRQNEVQEEDQAPVDETLDQKKARLTSKPLSDTKGSKRQVVVDADSSVGKAKKRDVPDASEKKKKPAEPSKEPYIVPQKRNKSGEGEAAQKPLVKSFAQIMAEKEAATGSTAKGAANQPVEAAAAVGFSGTDTKSDSGKKAATQVASKVASKVVSTNLDDVSLMFGIDPEDL